MEVPQIDTNEAERIRLRFGTGTTDEFVAAVPWGESRTVLVHRRIHGWREYVRFRTWNRHCTLGKWYPSMRHFIIPIEKATALADALYAAVEEETKPKPDWLVQREDAENEQIERMAELGVDEATIIKARQRLAKERKARI